MVSNDASRQLQLPARWEVACRRLDEEEGFLRSGVGKLFDVFGIIPSDSDNLIELLVSAQTL